jgi:molybdenum cofactor biosynthesis protein MoaF
MTNLHKISLRKGAHTKSNKLTGKRIWFHYQSGETLEQYYKSDDTVVWTGIKGAFVGHSQEEKLYVF